MPSLGADMEAGTLVEWKVRPGDRVQRGQVIAVVETAKGAIEVEVWEDGVVGEIRVAEGTRVPVGTVLAVVGATAGAGEPPAPGPSTAPEPAPGPISPPAAPGPLPGAPPPAPAPVVTQPAGRARASPAARARARELGLDLSALRGTGPGGAVTLADVEAGAARPPAPAPGAGQAPPAVPAGMRQAIGAAMARSKREIPHYHLDAEFDLSAAMAWLTRTSASRPVAERLLPAVLLLKAVALVAREAPDVNGHFVDGTFRPSPAVHLGVAISLRRGGLVAPAIHDADRLPLPELMRALTDLVARTRGGGLRSSELADSTLTVTSLGDLGVDAVHGIIYPPQVALVGFGRIADRPRARAGRVEVVPTVIASLAGDHRVSDGLSGARFLAEVGRRLGEPEGL